MPTYYTIDGVKIQLFFNDHVPPHFHAVIAEHQVLIVIDSLEVLEGSLPKSKLKKIVKWAKENQEELKELWELHRKNE
ncbi:DUF4160 domain-containing protein [Neolewinella antarctica]|uniref:DUF4160 domain-containing protein n=1 Tax=Neolewinella antarctica TaxID=442734 RepID=A0ABX0XH39_9BACT|nr:DUF4160 domain-containing protein [Neolewinella antarctica]NJC28522.1 hypothetical protein [Neolewinella antarctica]